jgi:LuxR family maltose regulon positive regulatory protein
LLLETKLHPPPIRERAVSRPHLIQRIDISRQLTLASAPAGYGKTTLISAWLAQRNYPALWLSLDEYDNDLARFGTYITACLRRVGVEADLSFQSPDLLIYTAIQLVNEIAAHRDQVIWVFDDYHHITNPHIHQLVQFILDNQPPNLHLVILTREDPPLKLPRLRVRQRLNELRERDLRFDRQEVERFFERTLERALPATQIDHIMTQTEGWIAGLQLVALAVQEGIPDVGDFDGRDRYVADYLVAEVLARLPPDLRLFLCQTSILERLTAPLCAAVTGREDSRRILMELDQRNLFLIPLDHQRETYRYHVLFRGFLQAQLADEERAALHRRAQAWYEARELWDEAITHALVVGQLQQQYAEAVRLIENHVAQSLLSGSIPAVYRWLDALPDAAIRQSQGLLLFKGWASYMTGDLDTADVCLTQISPEEPVADVLRCQLAFARKQIDRAAQYARRVLDRLPESPWRVMALWILAEAQEAAGEVQAMIASLRQIVALARDDQIFGLVVGNFLAVALNNCGRRQEALVVAQRAAERSASPVVTLVEVTLGRLYYEANQLEQSAEHFDQGQVLAQKLGLSTLLLVCYGMRAPLYYAQEQPAAAFEALEVAYQLAAGDVLGETAWVYAHGVNLHLQDGNLLAAQHLAAHLPADQPPGYQSMDAQISYGRWLVAANQITDARHWLDRLETYLVERDLRRWLLSVYLLQALIADRLTDTPRCDDYLARAVRIAAPESYLRAFLDEDPHLLTLLPAVRTIAPGFIDQVLAAADLTPPSTESDRVGALLEPLSSRELEVLYLIAQGYANAEIADKLVVATSTVKRHINHIYAKLGVSRRSQAILKAQQLDLL